MAEEQIINPNTALDQLVEAAYAPEEDEEVPAEEQPDELDSTVEEPQEESPEEEIAELLYLNDFAKDVDVDVADVYELSVKMPDEMEATTISELKNFKIANADIDQVRHELKNREIELQVQADAMRDVPQVSNELMMAKARRLAIEDQYSRINWDALRVSNPAEWTALQMDFTNQREGAKAEEAAATNRVDTQKLQAREFQRERLLEVMPELRDAEVAEASWKRVNVLASKFGYSQAEVGNIEDARLMRMMIHFSKQDIADTKVRAKLDKAPPKKAKTAPRMPTTRKASLQRLKDKAAKTGTKQDIDAFIDAALR